MPDFSALSNEKVVDYLVEHYDESERLEAGPRDAAVQILY